jgi:hypothetical protein
MRRAAAALLLVACSTARGPAVPSSRDQTLTPFADEAALRRWLVEAPARVPGASSSAA